MDDKNLGSTLAAMPPLSAATKFAVLASPNDFGLYCGVMRMQFGSDGEPVKQEVQYTQGFSLSPSSAKQLMLILASTLKQYEEAFGPVPIGSDEPKAGAVPQPSKAKPNA